jgi:hypothetical protein
MRGAPKVRHPPELTHSKKKNRDLQEGAIGALLLWFRTRWSDARFDVVINKSKVAEGQPRGGDMIIDDSTSSHP